MVDWHCHILTGLDDGPKDMEQSLSMASSLATAGFTTVYCTPHLIPGSYDATNEDVCLAVAELQEQLSANNIALTLFAGREYRLDEYLLDALQTPLPLGDSGLILVEIPDYLSGETVCNLAYDVVRAGFTPVIAHPERCPLLTPPVYRKVGTGILGTIGSLLDGHCGRRTRPHRLSDRSGNLLLDYLRDLGCAFQGSLGSFNGFYGHKVKTAAESFRRLGIYDRYGSDMHNPKQANVLLGGPLPH